MQRPLQWLMIFAVCVVGSVLFGQQPPPPLEGQKPPFVGPEEPPRFPPEMRPEDRERWMMKKGFRPEFVPGLKMEGAVVSPFEMNAVDQARFQIAALLVEQKKYEDAIGELFKTVEESPDENAVSAAHLTAGNIFRIYIKDIDKAVEQYREVKGKFRELAIKAIVDAYTEAGKPEEAIKEIEVLLANTQEPGQKIRLLNMEADVYRRSGKSDKAIEALRKITETITYDEAEALRKGWLDEEAQLEKIEERIRDLRAAGRHEEADRLQKEAEEIKTRKQMREALKKQKRIEKEQDKKEK